MNKVLNSLASFVSLNFSVVQPAYAQITNNALQGDLGSGDPATIFSRFITSWWGVALVAAGIIFLIYLIWGGIEWLISGSNKDRVENAKNKISNALIGLTILAISFALVKLIGFILGIEILRNMGTGGFNLEKLAP